MLDTALVFAGISCDIMLVMSKAVKKAGIKMKNPKTRGKTLVQQKSIIWSNLTRGNVALAKTQIKHKKKVFKPKIKPVNKVGNKLAKKQIKIIKILENWSDIIVILSR